jgi:hypothetical protein
MPLQHVLWRLSEGRSGVLWVCITSCCEWASCGLQVVELTMRLVPQDPKPVVISCPLCKRSMKILAGRAQPPERDPC